MPKTDTIRCVISTDGHGQHYFSVKYKYDYSMNKIKMTVRDDALIPLLGSGYYSEYGGEGEGYKKLEEAFVLEIENALAFDISKAEKILAIKTPTDLMWGGFQYEVYYRHGGRTYDTSGKMHNYQGYSKSYTEFTWTQEGEDFCASLVDAIASVGDRVREFASRPPEEIFEIINLHKSTNILLENPDK